MRTTAALRTSPVAVRSPEAFDNEVEMVVGRLLIALVIDAGSVNTLAILPVPDDEEVNSEVSEDNVTGLGPLPVKSPMKFCTPCWAPLTSRPGSSSKDFSGGSTPNCVGRSAEEVE